MSKMHIYDETNLGVSSWFRAIAHNIYLLVAAETGMIGLLVFLWFNFAIFSEGWGFVRADVSFLTNVGLSFILLIVMYFLFGMVNPVPKFVLIYFSLGMLVAIKKIVNERKLIPSG